MGSYRRCSYFQRRVGQAMIKDFLRSIWADKPAEEVKQEEPKAPLEWNRLATFDEKDEEYYATHGPKGPSWERAMKGLEMAENEQHWDASYGLGTTDMKLNMHIKDFMDIPSEQLDGVVRDIAALHGKMGHLDLDTSSAALTEQYEKSLAEHENGLKESPYKRLCEWIDQWPTEHRVLLAYELRYELEDNGFKEFYKRHNWTTSYYDQYEVINANSFDDAMVLMRQKYGDEWVDNNMNYGNLHWRSTSVKHGLYSLYACGDFKGCIQLPVGEKMPEEGIGENDDQP